MVRLYLLQADYRGQPFNDEYILVAESRFQAGAPLAKSDVNCLKNAAAHGDRFFYINFEGADPPGARLWSGDYGSALSASG